MPKASWMTLLTIGMLLSAAGFADDAKSSSTDGEPLPEVTLSVEAMHAELGYTSRRHLFPSVEAMAYSDDWPRPIADLDFQDNSALGRINGLRDLSFLTLAESRRSRLFLGVNNRGLVGLHFVGLADRRGKKEIAVFRMPYLRKKESDTNLEQVVADSN